MYPQFPDAATLAGMSADQLRALAAEFRQARRTAATENPSMSAEDFDAWTQAGVHADMLKALAADAAEDEAEATRVADEAAAAEAAEAEAAAAAEALAAEEANPEETEEAETEETEEAEEVETTASTTVATLPTGLSLPAANTPTGTGWIGTGVGAEKGHAFTSGRELGLAMQEAMSLAAAGDNTKRTVARMPSNIDPSRILSDEQIFTDLNGLSEQPDEVTAAFCTPLTPLYDLACANATRRPVFNGLPAFQPDADRGGFRVPESPSLFDITGGFGQWTSTNDADLEAIKAECQTISCVNWNDYEWYATYRCLKVRNLMQMTFPELVDAYLNRLQARWARYAETLLLEQMGTASTSIEGHNEAYGANVSLHRQLLKFLGLYADIERWDTPSMDAWMPRWLGWALQMDLASRRQDGSTEPATMATVERYFRDIGVEPHWYMDRPSWATPFNNLAVSGDLNHFPSSVEILVHRRGKFAVMDKGEVTVGLGGNPIRIEDDVRRNQATFFFESAEGLIDTDSCPAYLINVPGLCYSGVQIADTQIECEGYDLVGVGSG